MSNEEPRRRLDVLLDQESARRLAVLSNVFFASKTEAITEAISLLYRQVQPVKTAVLKLYDHISDSIQTIEAYRDYQAPQSDLNDAEGIAYAMLSRFWDEIRTLALFEEPFSNDEY